MVGRKLLLACLLSGMTLTSCASAPPPLAAGDAKATYALGTGDKLRITVYDEPALTGEYTITPSGDVSFPLIGNVPAAGHPIEQVQTDIAHALASGYVSDPKVSVEFVDYRPFYVLGQVNKPGEYPYVAGLSIEQAVATAGGFTYRANERKVFVRRAHGAERTVDLRSMPTQVLPGDTIRVGQRYF